MSRIEASANAGFDRIGQVIRSQQEREGVGLVDLPAERRRFLLAESETRTRSRTWVALAAAVLAVVCGIGLWNLRAQSNSLRFTVAEVATKDHAAGTRLAADNTKPLDVEFSDGSSLELGKSSRGEILALSDNRAHFALTEGRAEIHVNPSTKARWQFDAGQLRVNVTGTLFVLDWSPAHDRVSLLMREGKVTVTGCGLKEPVLVRAGETLTASCNSARIELNGKPLKEAAPSSVIETAPAPNAIAGDPPKKEPARAANWRELGRAGKYEAAYRAALVSGIAVEVESASGADLLLLADIARYTSHFAEAALVYQSARKRLAGTEQASLAAFALGRMAFDQNHAYADAARHFRAYLREQPSGKFAIQARGRLMEALHKSGQAEAARVAAGEYLRAYPSGPHAAQARRLLDAAP